MQRFHRDQAGSNVNQKIVPFFQVWFRKRKGMDLGFSVDRVQLLSRLSCSPDDIPSKQKFVSTPSYNVFARFVQMPWLNMASAFHIS